MSQDTNKTPSDLEIMMYLDGELSGTEGQAVQKWLDKDGDAALKAKALGQIGQVVRTTIELDADDADNGLAGLWSAIDKSIHANGASKDDALAREKVANSVAEQAEKRATDALVAKANWFSGWQGHVVTGALVAVTVAVVTFLMRPERVVETNTIVQPPNLAHQEAVPKNGNTPMTIPVVLESQDPEVEELEVYDGSGVIMTIPADTQESGTENGSSAVIWISNDTDVVEDPV